MLRLEWRRGREPFGMKEGVMRWQGDSFCGGRGARPRIVGRSVLGPLAMQQDRVRWWAGVVFRTVGMDPSWRFNKWIAHDGRHRKLGWSGPGAPWNGGVRIQCSWRGIERKRTVT